MKPLFLNAVTALSLSLTLVSCQTTTPPTQTGNTETATPQNLNPVTLPTRSYPALSKTSASGSLRLDNNTLILTLNLPELPEPLDAQAFATQKLDLSTTTKLFAQVSDSHGKTYAPNGADGDGAVNYTGGTITLTFNNLTPDELLFVDVQAKNGTTPIPQAQLATVIKHTTDASPVSATLNFQTAVAAKALKAMLPTHATQARGINLTDLNALTTSITGVTGTAPNLTYNQNHPSLVNTALLATHLQSQAPNTLTAADYRQSGATVNLTVSGLTGSDKVQVQITDAASAVRTNLGNGTTPITSVTPGGSIQVRASAFGSPSQSYIYNVSPAIINPTEGTTLNVTVTADPSMTIAGFSPTAGPVGSSVTITGSGFTGTTAVSIGGASAAFTVNNDSQITATVPVNAGDGTIGVTNGNTMTSATAFDVYRRIHVKANASGANNGTNWANAYTQLQDALAVAQANEEIWIAAGTYKPHVSDTGVAFQLKEDVKVYGGFNGTETQLNQRDFVNHSVKLSGDLGGDDDYSINPPVYNSANSQRIVLGANNALLDGVQILGGSSAGVQNTSVSPIIRNTLIAYNRPGMVNSGSSANIENVIFYRNRAGAGGSGGGVMNNSLSTPTFRNVVFTENTASSAGGAMLNAGGSNPVVVNSVFANDSAVAANGIWNDNGTQTSLTNSLFWNDGNREQLVDNAQGNFVAITDPFFNHTDPDGADNIWFTADDGLRLIAGTLIDQGVTGALVPGTDILNVTTQNGRREPGAYEYIVPPFSITTFSPSHGSPGESIVITGSGFLGTSAVRFNGVNATYTVNSATQITATVPAGATDGPITVVNGGNTVSNVDFDVTRIVYVKANASGANNGTSWSNAYSQLHMALTNFEDWDQIWVAAGTYKPLNASTAMTVPPTVNLYGGFAGNESSLSARNPATNLSLITGDMNGDDNYATEPFGNISDNAGQLLRASYNNTIDGFTLEGSTKGSQYTGNALHLFRQSFHPTDLVILNNLIFKHNMGHNGGGLNVNANTRAKITNILFDSNFSKTGSSGTPIGGGLIQNSSSVSYENITFMNHKALDNVLGGAMACVGGTATMKNVVFVNNVGNAPSTAIRGAALSVSNSCNLSLTNATFAQNQNLSDNSSGIQVLNGGTLTTKNTLLWDTPLTDVTLTSGNGNIIAGSNPFVNLANPLGNDGRAHTADDGLRIIGSASTVINQGQSGIDVPTTDIRGANRISSPEPGAYEYTP